MITPEQRAQRKNFIGASEVAALFVDDKGRSLDPFKTAVDVVASKIYDLKDLPETDAISRGNRYEAPLMEFAASQLQCCIETDPNKLTFLSPGCKYLAANLDGYTMNKAQDVVEAKTTSMGGKWGDPGTDDVPMNVILQTQAQMHCKGAKRAHVAVLLGRFDRLCEYMYIVEPNDDIIGAIIERVDQVWNDYVLTKTLPPKSEPGSVDLFKRIMRVPNKYANVEWDVIEEWEDARNIRLAAEKDEENRLARLLAQLGDAEGVLYDQGREFTYFETVKHIIDQPRLRVDFPQVALACDKESFSRTPRIRKRI